MLSHNNLVRWDALKSAIVPLTIYLIRQPSIRSTLYVIYIELSNYYVVSLCNDPL